MRINLDGDHDVTGRVITTRSASVESTVRLPAAPSRVVLHKQRDGRGTLTVGNWSRINVTIVGPYATLRAIRDNLTGGTK